MNGYINYQRLPYSVHHGEYSPYWADLIGTSSCEEEAEYLRKLAESDPKYAYNMVYVTRMRCGHYELFQSPQNEHYPLESVLEQAREYAESNKCTRCIRGF